MESLPFKLKRDVQFPICNGKLLHSNGKHFKGKGKHSNGKGKLTNGKGKLISGNGKLANGKGDNFLLYVKSLIHLLLMAKA